MGKKETDEMDGETAACVKEDTREEEGKGKKKKSGLGKLVFIALQERHYNCKHVPLRFIKMQLYHSNVQNEPHILIRLIHQWPFSVPIKLT